MLKKRLNIALTILLLVALTGFTSTYSLCCCTKEKGAKSCCQKKKDNSEKKKDCCKSVTVYLRVKSDLLPNSNIVKAPDYHSGAVIFYVFNSPSILTEESAFSGQYYESPPGIRDIPVLLQCFRN
jgi:hypothetical protein